MKSLQQKIIVVTGGSQGLGEAIVERLAKEQAVVWIGDVNISKASEVAHVLTSHGYVVFAYVLDVRKEESISAFYDAIVKQHGTVDIVINNAGIDVTKPLEELTVSEWRSVIDVNLSGPFLMSKLAFPLMEQRKHGHIVNITSTAAKRAWDSASAYHASKWGLLGFSHALHVEGRKKNIKVTAVVAGGMKTPFILDRFPEAAPNLQDPKNVADTVAYVLLQPDETVIPEVMVLPMRETSWP